jgi:maltose O-acetyltransferase
MIENKKYIFNKFNKRPDLTKKQRVLLKLYKFPFLNNFRTLKIKLLTSLNIPIETEINQGFSLSSGNLKVGNNVSLADTFFLDFAPIYIGNNVSFSFRNMVITSTHDINDFNNVLASLIIIEDNVWITSNVTILGGVRIGKNSIIGAGSVVTHDIPSGVFAAGNPCQVIREIRFNK